MHNIDEKVLEQIVRKIIEEKLGKSEDNKDEMVRDIDPSGVMAIRTKTVKTEKFDTGKEGDQVYLKDVFSVEESPRLGCGVMEMKESEFDWTLKYDEVDYIIEGTLEIEIDGRRVVGHEGDIMLIPKNSKIKFSAPNYAKFIYVVYPANWADQ